MTQTAPSSGAEAPRRDPLRLSVVVPVYNERYLVAELLRRLLRVMIPEVDAIEILVVDDGSTDGTREILQEIAQDPAEGEPERLRLFLHEENRGKGAAVRTGLAQATGDLIVFQDADLEYDPQDLARMVKPFLEDGADAVYGSRFLAGERRRVLYFRHTLGNRLITLLSNLSTDLNLTDVETCYKMVRGPLLKSIPIRSNDFRMEPEITAKLAKRQARIFEVPISYVGRTYQEGKKIGWRDGFKALGAILRWTVVDDAYAEDAYGSQILQSLQKTRRFNRWMAQAIAPAVGDRVLEIGAGIGNITNELVPRSHYVASDLNPHYLHYLGNQSVGRPYLDVHHVDLEEPADFEPWRGTRDTVICLNVLEHVRDPLQSLRNMHGALAPGGRLVLYVPEGPGLYCRLDEVLGHRCRYTAQSLRDELRQTGFTVESIRPFNRFSRPGWWWNGKVLRRSTFSRVQLKVLDLLIPLISRIDRFLPWKGLGLIAVARKTPPVRQGAPYDRS